MKQHPSDRVNFCRTLPTPPVIVSKFFIREPSVNGRSSRKTFQRTPTLLQVIHMQDSPFKSWWSYRILLTNLGKMFCVIDLDSAANSVRLRRDNFDKTTSYKEQKEFVALTREFISTTEVGHENCIIDSDGVHFRCFQPVQTSATVISQQNGSPH